jgi:DNA-3-methyladenine glycosylase
MRNEVSSTRGQTPRPIEAKNWQSRKTLGHARNLLGKYLARRGPDGRVERRMITEVEAYDGERDLACHAAKGRTRRCEPLYAAGGSWYVYLCYGMHEMLNLVVGPAEWPAAVLIRGVEGLAGPGRVTKALKIGRALNAIPATPESGLWIEDWGVSVPRQRILATPRIGIDYAGEFWAGKRWRFILKPEGGRKGGLPPRLQS